MMASVSDVQELEDAAFWNMDVLLEVHDETDLERAFKSQIKINQIIEI